MGFDPKTKKYPYPKDTAMHYLKIKKNRNINLGLIVSKYTPRVEINTTDIKLNRIYKIVFNTPSLNIIAKAMI